MTFQKKLLFVCGILFLFAIIATATQNARQIPLACLAPEIGLKAVKGEKGESGDCDSAVAGLTKKLDALEDKLEKRTQDLEEKVAKLEARVSRIPSPGWYTPGNGYEYYIPKSKQNWQESRKVCQRLGADLATVGMRDLNIRLKIGGEIIKQRVWIGLSDQEKEGSYVWIDKHPATKENIHWMEKPKQPDGGRRENCDEVIPGSWKFRTNDNRCIVSLHALCEKEL